MDKETLSNYGWIVICVLVLSVMIALATPFGDYISTAVKSTTQGLFDTNKNALNSTGLINVGDQSFSDGTDTGGSGNGNQTTEIKREAGSIIPDGAKYTKADGTTLDGNGTNTFPDAPTTKDTYEEGDYKYTYNRGYDYGTEWSVEVKDKTKTEYESLISEIAGKSLTNMANTFSSCKSLVTAPKIPDTVTSIYQTFYSCESLTTAPEIPSGVTNVFATFAYCESLTAAPVIPNSVTEMKSTFSGCTSLTTVPQIPNSVIDMNNTFHSCKSLTTAPAIPSSVTKMQNTFYYCTSLTTAPAIPNSVIDMNGTFMSCESLTIAPVIPNSVTDMRYTFNRCKSLITAPTIPNSVMNLTYTFEKCTSLTGNIEINANNNIIDYGGCFNSTIKPISISGSCSKLSQLAKTATNGNVTVAQ